MNNKYQFSDDEMLLIADNEGNISKRELVSKESLLLENKIEMVDDELKKYKNTMKDLRSIKRLSIAMLKLQPIIVLGMLVVMLLKTLIDFSLVNILMNIIPVITASIVVCVPATIIWGSIELFVNLKIKKCNNRIANANKMKKEYELEKYKIDEDKDISLKEDFKLNEVVSLEEDNQLIYSQIQNRLNERNNSNRNKSKRLVLTKNNKRY